MGTEVLDEFDDSFVEVVGVVRIVSGCFHQTLEERDVKTKATGNGRTNDLFTNMIVLARKETEQKWEKNVRDQVVSDLLLK